MERFGQKANLLGVFLIFLTMILGCGESSNSPVAEWTKSRKIAGKEQKLSHISGLVIDENFAYVMIGGTVADQNEGTSGLRKVAFDSGAVTILENGENFPQSDYGGIALDENFIYWNGGGKILRIAKDGGKPEIVASENVGIGLDIAIDNERIYWANHGYYSPNSPTKPRPIYSSPKQGGKTEIFADAQNIPGSLVADEKFVYWVTPTSIVKQPKIGGQLQIVFQASDKEGVDELAQDAENLYFGFRGAGESSWALRKVSKNGGKPQTLVKTFSLKQFTVDDKDIYFFNEDGFSKDALFKISKNGGDAVKLDGGHASGVIAQSKTQVYFAGLDDIYSFSK
jgi:hypothetical protein